MKIGLDMDEVIVEFVKSFLDYYNGLKKTDFKYSQWTSYNFWEIFGGTKEEAIALVDRFHHSDNFDKMNLVEGCREGIEELARTNELCIITARPIKFREKTNFFMKQYFSDFPMKIFYSNDFHDQHNFGKSDICAQQGVDIFVEDNLNYALSCSQKGIRTILFDKPWNQYNENGLIRLKNWGEIVNKIKQYS